MLGRGSGYGFLFLIDQISDEPALYQPLLRLKADLPYDPVRLEYEYQLPPVQLFPNSLFIIPLPHRPHRLGRASVHRWRIWNAQDAALDVQVKVDSAEDYVYKGLKQLRLQIEPYTFRDIKGMLVPLRVGRTRTPSIVAKAALHGDSLVYETLSGFPISVLP